MNEIIRKLSLAGNKRPVTNKDMSQIENKLGIVIPDDMKAFYLCLNGTGVLGLDVECMFHSPITGLDYEISHFISFKYGGAQFTIDGGASIARIEENRASNLLVFAIAEDHSRFVIDVKTGNIYNYKHKEIKWYYTKEGRQIFFDVSTYDEQADNFWRTSSEPFRSEQAYYLGDKTLVAESFSEFILHLSVTDIENLKCHNLKDGTQLGYKMPNLKSITIYKSPKIRDLNFLLGMKMIQCIYLYGLSNLSHVPNLCNLPNLRRIGICNMKRLEQMPTLNRELESLDVEKNVPMLGVDSFRDVTPINLPNLKWIRINLGNDVKSNMILDRFKNICETTRW